MNHHDANKFRSIRNAVLTYVGRVLPVTLLLACDFAHGEAAIPAMIGYGFNNITHSNLLTKCLSGNETELPSSEITSNMSTTKSWRTRQAQMGLSVPGLIHKERETERARFVYRARDTHLSVTYVFTQRVAGHRTLFSNTALLDGIHLDDPNFIDKCGTHYLSTTVHGGELHVGVKLSFRSQESKAAFSTGSIDSITGIGARLHTLDQDILFGSSVEIFFYQVGGNMHDLHGIVSSSDVVQCSMTEFDKCEKVIQSVYEYSGKFAQAVLDGHSQVIDFSKEPYPGFDPPDPDPAVVARREELLQLLDILMIDRDYANNMNDKDYDNIGSRELYLLQTQIQKNISTVKVAIGRSFTEKPEKFLARDVSLQEYQLPKERPHDAAPRLSINMRWATLGLAGVAVLLPTMAQGYRWLADYRK